MKSKDVRESDWVTCLIVKVWEDVEVGGTYCVAGELPEHLDLRSDSWNHLSEVKVSAGVSRIGDTYSPLSTISARRRLHPTVWEQEHFDPSTLHVLCGGSRLGHRLCALGGWWERDQKDDWKSHTLVALLLYKDFSDLCCSRGILTQYWLCLSLLWLRHSGVHIRPLSVYKMNSILASWYHLTVAMVGDLKSTDIWPFPLKGQPLRCHRQRCFPLPISFLLTFGIVMLMH